MSHIHTNPGQYDFTTSGYIVRLGGVEPVILLHMHKILGQWLQFGGHVEVHENPWQALTHEIDEESGYAMRQLRVLQPASRLRALSGATLHPSPAFIMSHRFGDTDHYHTDIAYGFVTAEDPAGAPGEGESSTFQAFSAAELRAIPKGEIPENVREGALFVLEECLPHWNKVKI